MKCPKCDAPITPGDKFCRSCGHPFSQLEQDTEQPLSTQNNDLNTPGTIVSPIKSPINDAKIVPDVKTTTKQKTTSADTSASTIVTPSVLNSTEIAGELKPGKVFAKRYNIIKEIGRGGMGYIYKAMDLKINEHVALKLLLPGLEANEQIIKRFIQEIKLALKITHENVVRIYDIDEIENINYISMEYIDGIDLKTLIKTHGKFSEEEGIKILTQICEGLGAAHKKGIIHRDVKPQNVLITSSGLVKIVDFGIAKLNESDGMTREGVVIGTPEYMSPEQALATKIDYRTDIYSTGVIMFEIFTGKLPFYANTPLGIALKHVNEAPTQPKEIVKDIPTYLNSIIIKAMAKKPEERFQKMEDLAKILLMKGTITSKDKNISTVSEKKQPEKIFTRGMELFNARKYREALQCFEEVLDIDPQHPKAYDYMEITGSQIAKEASIHRLLADGEQALAANNLKAALEAFSEANNLVPDNPEVQIGLRKVKAAISSQNIVISSDASSSVKTDTLNKKAIDTETHFTHGKKFFEEKKYDEAIEKFNAALEMNPDHTDSYVFLERAKAAKNTLDDIMHHFLTAKRLIKEEDPAGAKLELDIVLDYEPTHEEAQKLLKQLEMSSPQRKIVKPDDEGKIPLEMEQGTPASKEKPQREPKFVEMVKQAQAIIKNGDLQASLKLLQDAQEQFPDYDETAKYIQKVKQQIAKKELTDLINMGKEDFQLKNYRKAAAIFNKALQKAPDNKVIKQLIEKTQREIAIERKQMQEIRAESTTKIRTLKEQTLRKKEPEKPKEPSFIQIYLKHIIGGASIILLIFFIILFLVIIPNYNQKKLTNFKSQGKQFFLQGRYDRAITFFSSAYEMEPSFETLANLAKAQFFNGSYLKAQENFQKLLRNNPKNAKYYFYLGQIYEKNKMPDKAISQYQKVISLDDKNSAAFAALGSIFLEQKFYNKAINYLTISLELNSNQPDLHYKMAVAYMMDSQLDQAEIEFLKTIKLDERNQDAYMKLSNLYLKQKRYDEALKTIKGMMVWAPKNLSQNAEQFYLLGQVYEEIAKTSAIPERITNLHHSEEAYKKALVYNPKLKNAVIRLAKLNISEKNFERAIFVYSNYIADHPDDGYIHFELGVLYHRTKQLSLAYEHYRRASQLNPQNPKIWANFGTLLYTMKNTKEAKRALKKSLALDPDQPRVKRILNRIKTKMRY